jgi:hypothetical protein
MWSVVARALLKPRLLILLPRAAWRFRRRHWYRRPPFLPLPSAEYMRWRLHTAFGDEAVAPSPHNLESYLRWTEWMQKQQSAPERTDRNRFSPREGPWKQSSNI